MTTSPGVGNETIKEIFGWFLKLSATRRKASQRGRGRRGASEGVGARFV